MIILVFLNSDFRDYTDIIVYYTVQAKALALSVLSVLSVFVKKNRVLVFVQKCHPCSPLSIPTTLS